MKVTNEAINYLALNVFLPAINSAQLNPEIKVKVKAVYALIQKFKRVGDLHYYLARLQSEAKSETYLELRKLGLNTLEDVFTEFNQKFLPHLNDETSLQDFVIGKIYSHKDITIFSRNYHSPRGIQLIGRNDELIAIFSMVDLSGKGVFPNEWIEPGKVLKHYMHTYSKRFDESFQTNKAIIESGSTPIYIFIKQDVDRYFLEGIYSFESWSQDSSSKWFVLQKVDSVVSLVDLEDDGYQLAIIASTPGLTPEQQHTLKPPHYNEVKGRKTLSRDAKLASSKLKDTNYKCAVDESHATFISIAKGKPYVECHHLIPTREQSRYKNSLDFYHNLVGLCPNCHRAIHLAEDSKKKEIIKVLFEKYGPELRNAGFEIDYEMLASFYI